ncbi:MAG TPA: DNA polymerase IV, partial [Mycobacteriales bacterium]|nr:DNA polymerase IV [Mycobacteriales bacterium]
MFDSIGAVAPAGGATILHADLDAFYASVEQLLNPSLAGRPIAVGVGVVLAASYEAKAFGVHAGMSGARARRLCPDLRVVRGHFAEYQRLGDAAVDVVRDFTPRVERISIDEAFCDVAGSVHLFGTPVRVAARIRRRVLDELGLPLSVGVARTKHLAKIASQVAKPDGLVAVDPDRETEFLRPLPVGLVWGVGPATQARLAARGIHTIGDLAAAPGGLLGGLLGSAAGGRLA